MGCHPGSFQQFIWTGGIIKVSGLVLGHGREKDGNCQGSKWEIPSWRVWWVWWVCQRIIVWNECIQSWFSFTLLRLRLNKSLCTAASSTHSSSLHCHCDNLGYQLQSVRAIAPPAGAGPRTHLTCRDRAEIGFDLGVVIGNCQLWNQAMSYPFSPNRLHLWHVALQTSRCLQPFICWTSYPGSQLKVAV